MTVLGIQVEKQQLNLRYAMIMKDDEFEQYCIEHKIGHLARNYVNRVRELDPSRRAGGGHSNVVCRFASKKMGLTIQAESQRPEFAFVLTLEFDPDVLEFYDQPEAIGIEHIDRNGKRIKGSYTPDYFVLSKAFGPILIECKPDDEVEKLVNENANWWIDENGKVQFEPLRIWTDSVGMRCQVILSSTIPAKRVQNLQMLSDYYGADVPVVTEAAKEKILKALETPPWATRRQLLSYDDSIRADDINWMIAHRELYVDLDHQVLADEIRTIIFRDRTSADAYLALQRCSLGDDPFALRSLNFDEGGNVVLDGRQHKIFKCGETHLLLQDSSNKMVSMEWRDVDQLVGQGLLNTDVTTTSPTSEAARVLVRNAGPAAMDAALKQLAKLNAGPNDPPVPQRTREWLRARYRFGEREYGNGFLGLVPELHKRGNRNQKMPEAVIALMEELIVGRLLVPTPITIVACHGELQLQCQEKFLVPPTEKTFRKFVKKITKERITRAQRGHKAAHQFEPWHMRLEYATPVHGQRPFEIGHIDHTELDVHFVDEHYGTRTLRAWLTVLIDAYSRKVLSWHLTFEKPSYVSVMCVIRECLRRHRRTCDYFVVDQGAEFNSRHFEVLLARLGSHKKERPAGKPRFGNIVERFFGLATESLLKQLKGNNQFLKSLRSISPSHDPRKHAVWTLREFEKEWEGWIEKYYHCASHGTLGVSPNLAFDEGLRRYGYRAHRQFVVDQALEMMCLPAVSTHDECLRIDANHGYVKVHGVHYHGAALLAGVLHRKRVPVRYDPFDISSVYAYIQGQWQTLRSANAGDLEGYSLSDLKVFAEEMREKHRSYELRRQDNKVMLARFLRSVHETEKVLSEVRNRQRNEEKPDSQSPPTRDHKEESTSAAANRKSAPEFDIESHWAGVEV